MSTLRWVILLCFLYGIGVVAGHSFVKRSFDQLDSNLSVVYVNDYLTAVVWKKVAEDYKLNSVQDIKLLLQQQNLLEVAFIPASSKMSTLWTKVKSEFNQTNIVNFYGFVKGYGQRYHILEEFDVIITSRNLFLESFRNYQKGIGRRTEVGHLYQTSDFKFINIHPFSVYQVDEGAIGLNLSIAVVQPSCNSSTLTSFDYEPSLFNSFRLVTSDKMVSEYDMECLRNWNAINFKLISKTNQDVIKSEIESNYGFTSNSSISSLESLFLPSNCHNCIFEFCSDISLTELEYWWIPQTLIVIIHFLLLFFTGALKQPSLKRRLFSPFLPIVIIYIEITSSDKFWTSINQLLTPIGLLLNFCIAVHFFIYARLYFLRNLYGIFSLSKKINSTLLKLSAPIPGMLITFFFPLVLSIILSVPYLTIYFVVSLPPNLLFNIYFGIYIGLACITGLCVISIDLILNRKKWREKGLRYMLFFDDPFLIRVDMITLSFNIILLILISTVDVRHVVHFFRFVMFITFCLVCGGSCVIKFLIEKVRSSKSEQVYDGLESYLKHQDFKNLFREYCVKELSLENYNFFIFLLELKSKSNKRLSIDLMDDIVKDYLTTTSTFELNISASCKKKFFTLRKSVEDQQNIELSTSSSDSKDSIVTIQDLITIFEAEILSNLRDTFSRMESTNEFKTWLHAFKVQQQNNIF